MQLADEGLQKLYVLQPDARAAIQKAVAFVFKTQGAMDRRAHRLPAMLPPPGDSGDTPAADLHFLGQAHAGAHEDPLVDPREGG